MRASSRRPTPGRRPASSRGGTETASPPLDPLPHRLERVGRVALGVVGVDREEANAAIRVVARDVGEAVVPGQRVGAVVAGPDHDRRGRRRRVQRLRRPLGVGQLERRRRVADAKSRCRGPSLPRSRRRRPRARRGRLRVGRRRDAPVAQPVDAARQPRRLAGRRLEVAPVDADRRRADEALARGVGAARDLTHLDRLGVEPAALSCSRSIASARCHEGQPLHHSNSIAGWVLDSVMAQTYSRDAPFPRHRYRGARSGGLVRGATIAPTTLVAAGIPGSDDALAHRCTVADPAVVADHERALEPRPGADLAAASRAAPAR